MLRKLKLYGRLAKFLGQRTFEAEINSPIDAIKIFNSKFSCFTITHDRTKLLCKSW